MYLESAKSAECHPFSTKFGYLDMFFWLTFNFYLADGYLFSFNSARHEYVLIWSRIFFKTLELILLCLYLLNQLDKM